MNDRAEDRLPFSTILVYSAPVFGISFMALFAGFYLLKFSTDVLHIAPEVMGLIFLISRVWDGISDPMAGYLSDRTHTRIGRRRPWLIIGAIPVGLVFVLMWGPPDSLESTNLTLWMAGSVVLFYTALTVFMMPHDALGAELSTSYHERNRLFGYRRIFVGLGALPVFAAVAWLSEASDPRPGAYAVALVAAVITTVLMLVTGLLIRERPEYQGRGATQPMRALRDVGSNPHGRRLLLVYFLQQFAVGSLLFMTAYFSDYILGEAAAVSKLLGAFFVVSIISVPVWISLGRRFEKKPLVLFNMVGVGLALLSMTFLGEGDVLLATVISGIAGAAGGGLDVLFPSIQADVIDYDELKSGERKEGVYFAAWNFAAKTAIGLAGMLAGFLLGASGFEPNVAQSEATQFTIRLLMSGIPFLCYVAGMLVFMGFGLTRAEHSDIRTALDARG